MSKPTRETLTVHGAIANVHRNTQNWNPVISGLHQVSGYKLTIACCIRHEKDSMCWSSLINLAKETRNCLLLHFRSACTSMHVCFSCFSYLPCSSTTVFYSLSSQSCNAHIRLQLKTFNHCIAWLVACLGQSGGLHHMYTVNIYLYVWHILYIQLYRIYVYPPCKIDKWTEIDCMIASCCIIILDVLRTLQTSNLHATCFVYLFLLRWDLDFVWLMPLEAEPQLVHLYTEGIYDAATFTAQWWDCWSYRVKVQFHESLRLPKWNSLALKCMVVNGVRNFAISARASRLFHSPLSCRIIDCQFLSPAWGIMAKHQSSV